MISCSTNPNLLSNVQRNLLESLKILEPPSSKLYLLSFESIVKILCFIGGYSQDLQQSIMDQSHPELFFFADHLLKELSSLFEKSNSKEIQTHALKSMIEAVGSCLVLKFSHFSSYLWENSIPFFLSYLSTTVGSLQDRKFGFFFLILLS